MLIGHCPFWLWNSRKQKSSLSLSTSQTMVPSPKTKQSTCNQINYDGLAHFWLFFLSRSHIERHVDTIFFRSCVKLAWSKRFSNDLFSNDSSHFDVIFLGAICFTPWMSEIWHFPKKSQKMGKRQWSFWMFFFFCSMAPLILDHTTYSTIYIYVSTHTNTQFQFFFSYISSCSSKPNKIQFIVLAKIQRVDMCYVSFRFFLRRLYLFNPFSPRS